MYENVPMKPLTMYSLIYANKKSRNKAITVGATVFKIHIDYASLSFAYTTCGSTRIEHCKSQDKADIILSKISYSSVVQCLLSMLKALGSVPSPEGGKAVLCSEPLLYTIVTFLMINSI
jgi:hypothetical protein